MPIGKTIRIAPAGSLSMAMSSSLRALSQRHLVLLMALLATLPVWLCDLPLGTDIPQHAAQISLALDHFSSRRWVDDIQINFITPYLLTYVVGAAIAKLLGIVTAMKLLISLSLVGTVWATAKLLEAWGQDRRLAIFSILGLYGLSYQWGFLAFNLSIVLLLWLLAETRSAQASMRRLMLIALLLLLTHGLTATVAGLLILALTLVEPVLATRLRNYALILALLLPTMAWQALATTGVKGFGNGIYFAADLFQSPYFFYAELSSQNSHWINGWGRLTGLFPRILGWENGTAATLVGLALALCPIFFGYRLHQSKRNQMLGLALLAILFAMPSIMNGSLYSAERFSLLFFCFLPLLFTSPKAASEKLITVVSLAAISLIFVNCLRAADFNTRLTGLQDIIAGMPAHQHALAVSYSYQTDGFIAPVLLHAGQWYGAQKNGLVDPSFAATDLQPIRYRAGKAPYATIGNGFDWASAAHSWSQFHDTRHTSYLVHGSVSDFEAHTGCKVIGHQQSRGQWSTFQQSAIDTRTCKKSILLKGNPS